MKYAYLAGVIGLMSFMPVSALAQDNNLDANEAGQYYEVDDDALVLDQFGVTVDDIDDMDVYGSNGEEAGEVEDVLMNSSNDPVALAVETGEFLGIGGKDVIVPFENLELRNGRIYTSLTEEQMDTLPVWDD